MKTKNLLLVFAFSICFSSFGQGEKQSDHEKKIKGNFVHTVMFWLKDPNNIKDRETFEKGVHTLLNECKFITSSHVGIPADTATRPIVDASYTYCVVITFESKEAHDKYQVDPLHQKFVEQSKNLWSKVLVYDSEHL